MTPIDLGDAITSWLEQQRVRFRTVATTVGIPDSVVVPVPVLEAESATNSSGSYRDVEVSPVAILDWSLALERADPVVLDDDSVALARAITNTAGDRVEFFTFLGRPFVAQRVRDPSVLGTEDRPDPIVFGLELLYRALWAHLGSIRSLGEDHTHEARRRTDEFLAFVDGDTWTTVFSIPVAGLALAALPLEVGPVRIRALLPEEAAQLYPGNFSSLDRLPGRTFAAHPRRWWSGERHVIEVRSHQAKSVAPNAPPTWKKLVLAFQLLQFPLSGPGVAFGGQEPDWLSVGTISSPVFMASHTDEDPRELTAAALEELLDLATHITDDAVTTPRSSHDIALHRFSQATARDLASDSVVDSVVTLESLLLSGISDTRELNYRFSLNGAVYLSANPDERTRIFSELKDLYQLRSRLVHGGGRLPDAPQILDGAKRARQFAAVALTRGLREGWLSQPDFLNLLLALRPTADSN